MSDGKKQNVVTLICERACDLSSVMDESTGRLKDLPDVGIS